MGEQLDEVCLLHVEVVREGLSLWIYSSTEKNGVELVEIQVARTLVVDDKQTRGVCLIRDLDLDSSGFRLVEVFLGAFVVVAFEKTVDEPLLVVLKK